MNGTWVKQVATTKSLGVTTDDELIRKRRHCISYKALIQPHFDYCSSVCGTCAVIVQDKQQNLQNRAARVLTFSSYEADLGQLLEILGWRNLTANELYHHGIKMPTWVSSGLFSIKMLSALYKLQPERLREQT